MATATVATITFDDAARSGRILLQSFIGAPVNERAVVATTGGDGQGTKDFGFRERSVVLSVCYVDDTLDDCRSNFLDDTDQMNVTTFAASVAGNNYAACVLDPGTTRSGAGKQGPSSAYMFATIGFKIIRED